MLQRALEYAEKERELLADDQLNERQQRRQLSAMRRGHQREIRQRGRLRPPPEGFEIESALELFRMTGDLP